MLDRSEVGEWVPIRARFAYSADLSVGGERAKIVVSSSISSIAIMAQEQHLLETLAFRRAVASIQRRAEKQVDWEKLDQVFVKSDLFDRVQSPDSQLMLGRRGTGKTHLIKVFQQAAASRGELVLYVDCTRLGSGIPALDSDPMVIGQKYFLAFLNQFGTDLLDEIVRMELPDEDVQSRLIEKLSHGLVPTVPRGDLNRVEPTFNYRQIADSLEQIASDLQLDRLGIILDEWAQVPLEAQPFLAEYLKRSVLSAQPLYLKILAVNYQCRFANRLNGDLVGLERGADIPDIIDLDQYLVYDEKRDFVTMFFAQVLFNHLGVELGWDLSQEKEEKLRQIVALIFTQERAFVELVRAAEGNARDFLCIFSRAYFDEFRQSKARGISIPNIVSAAESWFDREKAANVDAELTARETLEHIMNNVLKGYKSRTFLVETSKADHPRLIRLLNERVLHRLNGTYSHPDRPGIRYELFTVDYGAFVRFRGTVNAVNEEVFFEGLGDEERKKMVPVDDKRSIRRITFDPESLDFEGDRQLKLPNM